MDEEGLGVSETELDSDFGLGASEDAVGLGLGASVVGFGGMGWVVVRGLGV